jgi:glycerol kinase
MIIGITRGTTKYHIIRATLESMAYQTTDVVELMQMATGIEPTSLKVDGGASANDLLLQFQADILGKCIERPTCVETTALGAAYLCGLSLGVYSSKAEIIKNRGLDKTFAPQNDDGWRASKMRLWKRAVSRALNWKED